MLSSETGGQGRAKTTTRLLPLLAFGLSLALGGCLRPLYGPSVTGNSVANQMASVEVVIVPKVSQQRLAHYLEQELQFSLDGAARQEAKAYRLELVLSQEVLTSSVNQATGQAVAAIVRINANYKLMESGTSKLLASGVATASAGYDRTPQRFSNLRAARDAELRAAKTLSEQLQTKIAAWFATRS